MRVVKVVLVLVGAVLAAIFVSGVVVGFVQADTTPTSKATTPTPKSATATKHETEAKHEQTRPDVGNYDEAVEYCATKYDEADYAEGWDGRLDRGADVDDCIARFGRWTYGTEWKVWPGTLAECREEIMGDRLYDGGPSDVASLNACAAHYVGS